MSGKKEAFKGLLFLCENFNIKLVIFTLYGKIFNEMLRLYSLNR